MASQPSAQRSVGEASYGGLGAEQPNGKLVAGSLNQLREGGQRRLTHARFVLADDALRDARSARKVRLRKASTSPGFTKQDTRVHRGIPSRFVDKSRRAVPVVIRHTADTR